MLHSWQGANAWWCFVIWWNSTRLSIHSFYLLHWFFAFLHSVFLLASHHLHFPPGFDMSWPFWFSSLTMNRAWTSSHDHVIETSCESNLSPEFITRSSRFSLGLQNQTRTLQTHGCIFYMKTHLAIIISTHSSSPLYIAADWCDLKNSPLKSLSYPKLPLPLCKTFSRDQLPSLRARTTIQEKMHSVPAPADSLSSATLALLKDHV